MKKKVLLLICISVLCTIMVLSVNADNSVDPRALYQDLNELVYGNEQRVSGQILNEWGETEYPRLYGADFIIVGNVIDEEPIFIYWGENDENSSPYTLMYVKVTEVIRGDMEAGDVIVIHQLGHRKPIPDENGIARLPSGEPLLKVDTNYLLFIHIHRSDFHKNFDGIYRLANHYQGAYPLDSEGNLLPYDNISNSVVISSVNEVRELVARGYFPKNPDKNTDIQSARTPIVTVHNEVSVANAPTSVSRSDVPKGGVTIGVIPVILSGTILIVAKKRKQ